MKDGYEISINDLSGALALPLISKLFAEWKSIEQLEILLQTLTVYFYKNRISQAFDMICKLLQLSDAALPQEFRDLLRTGRDKREFVGDFLTDFREILGELSG